MSVFVYVVEEHVVDVCAIIGTDKTRPRANTTKARTFMACLRELLVDFFDDPPASNPLQRVLPYLV